MIKIILPLILFFAIEVTAGDSNCLPGDDLKKKLSCFSMNLWPPIKDVNDLGIYRWMNDNGKDALKISLNKIPDGHCLNMIAGMPEDIFSDFKSGRKMRVILKYAFSLKSGEMKNMPFFSLRASSEDWKTCDRLFTILIEESDGKDNVKSFFFNGSNIPAWTRRLDFQLYGYRGDAEFIVKDLDIVLEEKPDIVFPFGAIISSGYSGKWFYITKKENMNDSDKVRIVIVDEDMRPVRNIETTFSEAGNIHPPELPGFYHLSIYRKVNDRDEKMIVGDAVIYVYNE